MKFAQLNKKQSGFTLVEIAIVLVIIGLLLGGVLKGQEMVENARIKSVIGDINGVSAAYNTYFDRYKAIPGDEAGATLTARGWTGTAVGNGNGVLAITPAQTFTNGGEQAALWRSLRASGRRPNRTSDRSRPAARRHRRPDGSHRGRLRHGRQRSLHFGSEHQAGTGRGRRHRRSAASQ
jgi:prepilin-type N-terminal cleavage/methylation domain-containing protein